MRKLHIILLLFLVGLWGIPSISAKKIKPRAVYMFGVSTAFMDSTVLITDIQRVDSVYLSSTGKLLIGRNLYSTQLQQHVEEQTGLPRTTCAVFYDVKPSKLQKVYAELKAKFTKEKNVKTVFVSPETFRFKPEIYFESHPNP